MATVLIKVERTNLQSFPLEIQVGNLRISLSNGLLQDVAGLEATFASIDPGDYTATAQLLDTNALPLGDPFTTTFTVPPATQMIALPSAITVDVQP